MIEGRSFIPFRPLGTGLPVVLVPDLDHIQLVEEGVGVVRYKSRVSVPGASTFLTTFGDRTPKYDIFALESERSVIR